MVLILDGQMSRYAGAILEPDGDRWKQIADTLQCCHCDSHWVVVKGSGRVRGWCQYCARPVCGEAPCMSECRPWEQQMETIERSNGLR